MNDNRQSELGGNDTPIERQQIGTIRAAAWIRVTRDASVNFVAVGVGELGCSIHTVVGPAGRPNRAHVVTGCCQDR
jgi:hypothetical protein